VLLAAQCPLQMVSGASQGKGVLDGVHILQGKGRFWGVLMSICYYGICHCVADRETYSVHVRKFDKISVRPIHCWKWLFVGFLKM